jgi:hypothetical protein
MKCLFYAVAVVDVNVNVEHARVVSAACDAIEKQTISSKVVSGACGIKLCA